MKVNVLLIRADRGLFEPFFVASLDPQGCRVFDVRRKASWGVNATGDIVARFN